MVAVATGRIDAIVFLVGITAGIFVFGEAFPAIQGFVFSTDMGTVTLPELFHLRYGLVLFAVVLMAIGGFYGAEVVEKIFARKTEGSRS